MILKMKTNLLVEKEQEQTFRKLCGIFRYVYNFRLENENMSSRIVYKKLMVLKETEKPWLGDVSSDFLKTAINCASENIVDKSGFMPRSIRVFSLNPKSVTTFDGNFLMHKDPGRICCENFLPELICGQYYKDVYILRADDGKWKLFISYESKPIADRIKNSEYGLLGSRCCMQNVYEITVHSQMTRLLKGHDAIDELYIFEDLGDTYCTGNSLPDFDLNAVENAAIFRLRQIKGDMLKADLCPETLSFLYEFWAEALSPDAGLMLNIGIQINQAIKHGRFHDVSNDKLVKLCKLCDELAKAWNGKAYEHSGIILPKLLKSITPSFRNMGTILLALSCGEPTRLVRARNEAALAEYEKDPDKQDLTKIRNMTLDDLDEQDLAKAKVIIRNGLDPEAMNITPVEPVLSSPRDIYAVLIKDYIHGQNDAVRAAAMVMYRYLKGERTNVLFYGPTGCGKTEIWRSLSKLYPGTIHIVDISRMNSEGYSGSVHLRDAFADIDPDKIAKDGLIVVFDEADKILCERSVNNSGTDYNKMLQGQMLKMLDGDVIEFGKDRYESDRLVVDCKNVSVVMLGAFERVAQSKSESAARIGFGTDEAQDVSPTRITYEDLIENGMRREVAGRINKLVMLDPLNEDDYIQILNRFIIPDLAHNGEYNISVDPKYAKMLVSEAVRTGLGVRYLKSNIIQKLDDMVFEDPDRIEYRIDASDDVFPHK